MPPRGAADERRRAARTRKRGRARPRRVRRAPCAAPRPRRRCPRRSGRRCAPAPSVRSPLPPRAPGLARRPQQQLLHGVGLAHARAHDERGHARDVRRRHRRAHEPQVVGLRGVAGDDRVLQDAVRLPVAVLIDAHVAARRRDVDLRAPVRVEGRRFVELRRRDGDDARDSAPGTRPCRARRCRRPRRRRRPWRARTSRRSPSCRWAWGHRGSC